jgi:hypothetical protein
VVAAERGLDVRDWNGQKSLLPEDHRRLLEMIWALITESVMTVGFENNESWPFVSLTEYGEEHVKGGQATPHDVTDFISRLEAAGPLDDIEERYITQSLQAYVRNLPDASAVMLGAASEHLLMQLVKEISAKDASAKGGADKALDGPALAMLRFARDYFVPKQKKLPRELRWAPGPSRREPRAMLREPSGLPRLSGMDHGRAECDSAMRLPACK